MLNDEVGIKKRLRLRKRLGIKSGGDI